MNNPLYKSQALPICVSGHYRLSRYLLIGKSKYILGASINYVDNKEGGGRSNVNEGGSKNIKILST